MSLTICGRNVSYRVIVDYSDHIVSVQGMYVPFVLFRSSWGSVSLAYVRITALSVRVGFVN